MNINTFPTAISYYKNETVNINPVLDPLYKFDEWASDSVVFSPNPYTPNASFLTNYNDTVLLKISLKPPLQAFIYGNDTVCDNANDNGLINVSFIGVAPYTFVYAINGVAQTPIPNTTFNPHPIQTSEEGLYSLVSYSDVNEVGQTNGEGIITVLPAPTASFVAQPDSMTILYTTTQLIDKSIGNITGWAWSFGDNSNADFNQNTYHTYTDSVGIYQLSLVISDNKGCSDTATKIITITDDYWIWIPNSFTPDMDGINDKFCIAYYGIRENTFTFNVFDRFSNLVYSTNNIHDLDCKNGWDGKHQSTGNELPMGAYIYKMYYQDYEGWKHQEIKELILIR